MNSGPNAQHGHPFGGAIGDYLPGRYHELNGFHWPIEEKCAQAAVRRNSLPSMFVGGVFAEVMRLRRAVAVRAREIQRQVPLPSRVNDLGDLAGFMISDWGNQNGHDPKAIADYVALFRHLGHSSGDYRGHAHCDCHCGRHGLFDH
jgi:hypothetical protein